MRNRNPIHKPSAEEIKLQTKEMFENVGRDVQAIEIKNDKEAENSINYLIETIQSSSEWDDIIAAETHATAVINGGALEFDAFQNGLPKLNIGLVYAATNTRGALVKSSCLLIALLARELGPAFDTLGDYINPLGKQLSNGTQFIADCSKYAILMIAKCCPGRKQFSYILTFCSSRGSQQRLVAANCLLLVMQNWNPEAIGTNWTRLYSIISKYLEDASPYVRAMARKTARAIKICSKQRSTEFFSRVDQRTRREIMAESDEQTKETTELPHTSMAHARKKEQKIEEEQTEDVKPIRKPPAKIEEDEEQTRIKPPQKTILKQRKKLKFDIDKDWRPKGSGIPVRVKKQEKAAAEEPKFIMDDIDNDDTIPVSPFSVDKTTTTKQTLKMVDGQEIVFLNTLKDYLDSGRSLDLSPAIKEIVSDLMKCISSSDMQILIPSLAVLHDLLPTFANYFVSFIPYILETILKLIDSPNPRASSNAHIVTQELAALFDPSTLLTIASNQAPTMQALNFISFLVRTKTPTLRDSVLCEKVLKLAFSCHDIDDLKSRQISGGIINVIYQVNGDAIQKFYGTLDEDSAKKFKDLAKTYLPGVVLDETPAISVPVPKFDAKNVRGWAEQIVQICSQTSQSEWNIISTRIYSEINHCITSSDQNARVLLRLLQKTFTIKGLVEYQKVLSGILLYWNTDPDFTRITGILLTVIQNKTKPDELLASLQQEIRETNERISKNAIDFETNIINSSSPIIIKPLLPSIAPALCEAIDSQNVEIRKSCVSCFVGLFLICGNEVEQHIKGMAPSQRKLIDIALSARN